MAISILIPLSSTPNPSNPNMPKTTKRPSPPILISANPSHLNPHQLQRLLLSSNFSCHRFPSFSSDGRAVPVDVDKLSIAVAHSSVVVSVFCRQKYLKENDSPVEYYSLGFGVEEVFERMVSVPDADHRLVGFGRAVSDGGLTASIHDVVGFPGYAFNAETRVVTSRQIYDISALCSEKERLFFEACGFGEDSLGSTTMIYTQTAPSVSHDDQTCWRDVATDSSFP